VPATIPQHQHRTAPSQDWTPDEHASDRNSGIRPREVGVRTKNALVQACAGANFTAEVGAIAHI